MSQPIMTWVFCPLSGHPKMDYHTVQRAARGDGLEPARAHAETPSRPLLHRCISTQVLKRVGPRNEGGDGGRLRWLEEIERIMGVQCREDKTVGSGGGPSGGSARAARTSGAPAGACRRMYNLMTGEAHSDRWRARAGYPSRRGSSGDTSPPIFSSQKSIRPPRLIGLFDIEKACARLGCWRSSEFHVGLEGRIPIHSRQLE